MCRRFSNTQVFEKRSKTKITLFVLRAEKVQDGLFQQPARLAAGRRCRYTPVMFGPVKHRSAGIVVVRRQEDGWRFLVLRAYRNWDFPKGLIEPGESPLAAARRETHEETGLDALEFRWGEESVDTEMYGDRKVATYFVAESPAGEVTLAVNPEIGRPEHDEYRWVTRELAHQLLPRRLQAVLDWATHKLGG
jgi:8-oxo-dGTP pyrophosphatase MutT (NUDIX family)